jgi:hypothetical protein
MRMGFVRDVVEQIDARHNARHDGARGRGQSGPLLLPARVLQLLRHHERIVVSVEDVGQVPQRVREAHLLIRGFGLGLVRYGLVCRMGEWRGEGNDLLVCWLVRGVGWVGGAWAGSGQYTQQSESESEGEREREGARERERGENRRPYTSSTYYRTPPMLCYVPCGTACRARR